MGYTTIIIWKCLTKNFPSSNFPPRIGRILGWIVCSSEIWQFFALYRNPPGKFLFHLHLFRSRSFGLIESTLWYWSLTAFRKFISSGTSVPLQRATKAGQVDLIMPRQQGDKKSLTCMILPVYLLDQWQHPSSDWPPPSCRSMTLVSRSHYLHHMMAWSGGIQNSQKQLGRQILLEHSRNSRGGWFGCNGKETMQNPVLIS